MFLRVEPFEFASLKKLEDYVPQLDYEVDGIVIEVNNLQDAEQLGREGGNDVGNPNWKLAWKFSEQSKQATVKSIRWQTGRTLKITPVGEFDPIHLDGTDVVNVTFHNVQTVLKNKLGVGAVVEVIKSGKIIPKMINVITPAPPHAVIYPSLCPSCGAPTKLGGEELWCTNDACDVGANRGFIHYLQTIGVKGVAGSIVGVMIAAKLLKTYADFYKVAPEQLQKAGCSVREAVLAWANIHMVPSPEQEKDNGKLLAETKKAAAKKKKVTLGVLLAAFGMDGSGKGTGRGLAEYFGTIDKLLDATETDLLGVPNVGDTTAKNVYKYLKDNRSAIEDLLKYVEPEKPKTGIFSNMTFVFTGSPINGKDYWINKVENEGGKCGSSVSRKTNWVVAGSDPGAKLDKAKELQKEGHSIKIIDVHDLKKMLGLDKNDDRTF